MGKFVLGVQRYENRTIFAPMKKNIIQAPMGETTVLLHTCCAPCSSAIIEALLQNGITPIIYYCNPNIYPQEEYDIRKNECTRYAQSLGLEIIDADYDHENWLSEMKGLECEPERGGRCLKCFKLRLLRTAQYARERGLKVITTTLASSRWKSLDQINEAGRWACDEVNGGMPLGAVDFSRLGVETVPPDDLVIWWDQNWRKGGLQERRNQIIREYDFYNQRYCGCEFSMPKDDLTSMQPAFTSEGTDSLV
jgi:predicted adenine nucleotide alpha hydrolase (AANH) superfamily ATPase